MTEIYSFSKSQPYSTVYEAKNSLVKEFIDNLAAATIPGWTVGGITSPAVSTVAAQSFMVDFEISTGYVLRFSVTTGTAASITLTITMYTPTLSAITTILTALIIAEVPSATSGMIFVKLEKITKSSVYTLYLVTGYDNIPRPFGELYFADKVTGVPDFLVVTCLNGSETTLYAGAGVIYVSNALAATGSPDGVSLNTYYALDLYVAIANAYKGKIKDTIICRAYPASLFFSTVNVDGVPYYRIGNGRIFVKV